MFKVSIDPEEYTITVTDPSRGEWTREVDGWVSIFNGFGGEDTATIQITPWQGNRNAVMITMGSVDSHIHSAYRVLGPGMDLNEMVNAMLDGFRTERVRELDEMWLLGKL